MVTSDVLLRNNDRQILRLVQWQWQWQWQWGHWRVVDTKDSDYASVSRSNVV
jgi:hypothetical protein